MPTVARHLWHRVTLAIADLSWSVLVLAALLHATISWALLAWAGDAELTSDAVTFAYFYVTTATTVGYGDLSPASDGGREVALAFVLPGSIALFTAFLGKAVADLGGFWRRRMHGGGVFSGRTGHTIVVGWQGARSRQLIAMLSAECARDERPVLLAPALDENPMPDRVDFVLAEGLSSLADYRRAGGAGARSVIVRGNTDDDTLAATLAARAAAPAAHIVAYFEDEGAASLVTSHDARVEAISSLSSQLLVRSSRDPGSSRMAELMFSGHTPDTAFSLCVPAGTPDATYLATLIGLKRHADLALIGLCSDERGQVDLNCPVDHPVRGGDTLFYIADARADPAAIDWSAVATGAAA